MPQMEKAFRTQAAVLWPQSSHDDYGQPTRGAAVEVKVRWVTGRRQSVNAQGVPVAVDATAVVDRQVDVGSVMWLGTLSAWNGTGSGGDESEVMEVLTYSETPDLKGRNVRREVGLAYYKDALPPTS